ncbi:MAG: PKD domain-containing protein [Ferruginibacter sp.]
MRRKQIQLLMMLCAIIAHGIVNKAAAQQTLTQINGWNAYVHLPASYNSSTTQRYPTIVFFPGIGEIGTNASSVIAYGPGAYITQGWDGNVVVDGNTVEFIVISLQPPSGYPSEATMNTRLQTIKSLYRVDLQRLYLTGLSHGGWCSSTFVTGDTYGGPYTYASQIAAVVTVEGVIPDDNQPYPQLFDNFALSGGKYLGFEQINDGRDTRTVVDRMNVTVPNSAVYVQTSFGSGGHCCWSNFYGGGGTQPSNFNLGGITQNLYQWLARQTLASLTNIPPVVNAGTDISITLPTSTASLNGSATDQDGNIVTYLWTQIAGPGASVIANSAVAVTTVSNLLQGQYQFELTVMDNMGAYSKDTMQITVNPNPSTQTCNTNAPVTHYLNYTTPGEIYRPNGSGWKGGDTVKITGTSYSVIEFYNIAGDPCRPIVIMPQTTVTTPVFRVKGNSRYLKIWGGNSTYGIKVTPGAIAITQSHHIEVDNVECSGGSVGVYAKQDVVYSDPTTWHPNYRMTKLTFKNMWVHDVDGEGMYIGITQPDGLTVTSTYSGQDTVILPIRLDSVEVSNCIVERTGWDGIQVSNARNGNKIINNTVRDFGLLNISVQQTGIILGGNCNGDVSGNTVKRGTGSGIQIFGYGVINVSNNILDSCGYNGISNSNGTVGLQGIYANDYIINSESNPKQTMNIFDNAINHPPTNGSIFVTNYLNNSFPSSIYNNTFCIPNAPANWESIYIKAYVPSSSISNNTLSCATVPNVAPVANAGADITITLPANTATLSGYGSDVDGSIASYAWAKVSGPGSGVLTNPGAATASLSGLTEGIYQYELTVTDNLGATGKDTVKVTVNPVPNNAPVANAGADIVLTLPNNTVSITGSGTDSDGTIAAYKWMKIAGPVPGTDSSNTALINITGLVQGSYQYQLTVTDDDGAIGRDTVHILVNPAPNVAPVAHAGSDIVLTLPVNSTTLNGSGTDTDGTIVSYAWVKAAGPAAGTISNATQDTATVTGLATGVYQYVLTVTDNNGASASDTVQVTVNGEPNEAPVANAGPDISITLPVDSAQLAGSGTDSDGSIASYTWTKISGPAAGTIASANAGITWIYGLTQGVYQYVLVVTDDDGASASDTMTLTVNPPANIAPYANAGPDIILTLPVNSTTLNGSGTDTDGSIVSYSWVKISGPAAGNLLNPDLAVASLNGLVQGVYQYVLTVTDNGGATATDTVQVTVNAAANVPPVANAGTDITITLPTSTVTLNGSGTDADGSVAAYAWTKIAGPAGGDISNAAIQNPQVNNLQAGIYSFELTVTDNEGASAKDTVNVIVNPANNIAPVANAGADKIITLPVNTTTLNGGGTDSDGSIVSYQWVKIAGPAAGTLTNAGSATATVASLVAGTYRYQLTVTDDAGAIGRDTMQVTVNPAPNVAPVANAGPDKTITLPVNTTTLNGSGTDSDGTIASYAWVKIAGPAAGTISNANAAVATIASLVQGVYQYRLTVTDNAGASASDTVQVTVNAAPNVPPVANAGANISITLPVNTVTLSGSGTDSDGTITGYLWTKISGPAAGAITAAGNAVTTVTGLAQGVYQFSLRVTDNSGATASDTVQVTVNPAPNIAPVANAGADKTITLPVNTTTLNGSGTDTDGTIASYAWVKIAGPAAGTISNANTATATVAGLVQGVYRYQLTVTDNNGATGRDTMQVTVNPAPNVPPTANAGPDKTITLPVNTTTLNGSGTDTDGTIASYAWIKISGPLSGTITNAAAAVATVSGLDQGTYQYQLTVTDNSGATAKDTMRVIVNAPANVLPVANAGPDKNITLPVNSTTLDGSGTDQDGNIASYAWVKIAGPASGTLTNANAAVASVAGLVQGVYRYQLTVTDNAGGIGRDTMQVTVNAALNQPPTANAGPDKNITLPVNSTTLNGSGTDPDGTIVSYAWVKIAGPGAGTITNANAAVATVAALAQGVYRYQLTVTDNSGASAKDTMQVTVNSAANQAPTANAGSDISITLPVNTAVLSGSGTDPDGTIASYAWVKIAGPATGTLTNANTANPTANGLVQGTYQYQLTVTDNQGATGRDTMKLIVNPPVNIPPVAHAGNDISITLPVNTAPLNGSGTDADGSVVSYAWTRISGPASGTISNAAAAITSVTGLTEGIYQYQLTVTDNSGAIGRDTVRITVNPAPNIPPVANAGADIQVIVPPNNTNLTGSGTDVDGTVVAYEWEKISGPDGGTIVTPHNANTAISDLQLGTYYYRLTVTDDDGATGSDTVKVEVINTTKNSELEVGVYPNPVITDVTAKIVTSVTSGIAVITLSDERGTVVETRKVTLTGNILTETFRMSRYAKGTYFMRVSIGGKLQLTKKIVKG